VLIFQRKTRVYKDRREGFINSWVVQAQLEGEEEL
jgi:hypothetical protein